VTDALLAARLDALHLRYARALDSGDMRAWADCFAREASYVCISRENVEQSLPVALMMDDTRARIEDRVKAVKEVWAGTFEEYLTRHFVQRMACAPAAGGRWSMESNFMIAYTTPQGEARLLTAGAYLDEIVLEGDEARLSSRKAVLDTSVIPRYLVYPV